MEEILEVKNISKSFGDKKVLDNVNFSVKPKTIVGILGKNGSGKTTLFKLINDLLVFDSGEILVDGKKIGVETKNIISYLPERTYFDRGMKVSEVLNFFEDFYEDFDRKKAEKLLKEFDLDVNQKFTKMSKGMQEKVQIILVVSRQAKLYIMDEPLDGIDPTTRDYILDTILTNCNEDASFLISTHLISEMERILDRVIFINDGKIILDEDADKLREKENCSIDEVFRKVAYVKKTDKI